MKSARRYARELAMQSIYQIDFLGLTGIESVLRFSWNDKELSAETRAYAEQLVRGVCADEGLDSLLAELTGKKFSLLVRLDRAIMKVALYEIRQTAVPAAVVINEAMELGRRYGEESSLPLINGVLDAASKRIALPRS